MPERRKIVQILYFISGILLGVIIATIINSFNQRPLGNLRVDRSDPTSEPYLFLELDTDVRTIMHKRRVVFKVRVENFLPHE